ncbi:MAG: pimeloyl-ACP methyl ester carboxylesterase [Gammaproteobacteria bacterium]|jgi:pimeloyl-ACP methyl ester carboxylesterase
MSDIKPFRIEIAESQLDDLRQRLRTTRWPERETTEDWSQGIPLNYVQEIAKYWLEEYDWRRCENWLNELPQFTTEIDGLDIHFLHIRSPHPNAQPLVITHGWPGSILEFAKVIGPLSDPSAHGGDPADAFHVVCPTLPGFGFSGKPTEPGWGVERIGRAWGQLMARLGYDSYVAQGGDWGAVVTSSIGVSETEHCAGIHINMPIVSPSEAALENLTEFEKACLAGGQYYWDSGSGYSKQQSTRPQTVGYGLVDSPVAQAAWIIEKFWDWTDSDGHPENVLSRDELLDNVMLYWLPGAGASSARLYWESFNILGQQQVEITLPAGASIFPHEIFRSSKRWIEERYKNLVHYNVLEKGGHFAAFEQPESFVQELRTCFRHMR